VGAREKGTGGKKYKPSVQGELGGAIKHKRKEPREKRVHKLVEHRIKKGDQNIQSAY